MHGHDGACAEARLQVGSTTAHPPGGPFSPVTARFFSRGTHGERVALVVIYDGRRFIYLPASPRTAAASIDAHGASLVFLASNADAAEVAELEAHLGAAVLRYWAPPGGGAYSYGVPELAVIDTLVCSLADAFIGTRRSMFTWNIFEERVLQGLAPSTGAYMS